MSDTMPIAPLQLLVIGFDQPRFTGQVAAELETARKSKLIRVVDAVAVHKDQAGELEIKQQSDLSFEEIGAYGAILGALLGLGSGSEELTRMSSESVRGTFEERYQFGLDKEDVADIADNLPAGSAAMFLLIEHTWALPLRDAIRQAGGMLLAQDFLSPELLIGIGSQTFADAAA